MSKGPKGCPRRRGDAQADAEDKVYSASQKRQQQRARQNLLVSTLDSLLPKWARCKPGKSAGIRSAGLQGRSVLNVLADCVELIKTAHMHAAALAVEARRAEHSAEESPRDAQHGSSRAECEPVAQSEWNPHSGVSTLECGREPPAGAERTPRGSFPQHSHAAPIFDHAETGTEATSQEQERWLNLYAQQACDDIFEACDSGPWLGLPPVQAVGP
jgi:hypothetical protein